MQQLTRKQRQIQERDDLILRTARNLFLAQGYHDVTMDMIAREVEYSKGTIYQHYSCKEGVISALCMRFSQVILSLFTHIGALQNTPAYLKCLMLLEAEIMLHEDAKPDHDLINLLKTDAFAAKLDESSLMSMNCHVDLILKEVVAIVEQAIEQGELALKSPATASSIALGCWAMIEGTYEIIDKHTYESGGFTSETIKQVLMINCLIFLRGSGWHALPVDETGLLQLNETDQSQLDEFIEYCRQQIDSYHAS